MAQKHVVQLIDDLDGKEIDEGGQTISFSYRGAAYEIDLGEKNARKFDDALRIFIAAARKTGGRRQTESAGRTTTDKSQLAAMRSWAKDNGFEVSTRGRVSRKVQEAYNKAR